MPRSYESACLLGVTIACLSLYLEFARLKSLFVSDLNSICNLQRSWGEDWRYNEQVHRIVHTQNPDWHPRR